MSPARPASFLAALACVLVGLVLILPLKLVAPGWLIAPLVPGALEGPLLVPVVGAAVGLAAVATAAARRFRAPGPAVGRDRWLTAGLLGLAVGGVVAAMAVAGAVGLLGA